MVRTRKRNYDEIQQQEEGGSTKSYVNVRRIPVETWLQVLCYIRRVELGLRVSMACRSLSSFAHICLFEKCKYLPGNNERSLGSVEIKQNGLHSTSILINGLEMDLPVDNCFVPKNIVRFDKLEISNVDDRALAFLRNISRLFVAVKLVIAGWGWGGDLDPRRQSMLLQHILPLCSSIQSLRCSTDYLCAIRNNFPGFLADCQMLETVKVSLDDKFNDVLSLLLQWLPMGRADGRPKVADLYIGSYRMKYLSLQLIHSLEKKFIDATAPLPFIVRITFYEGFVINPSEHLPMQNSATGEQFTLQISQHQCRREVLITRCALRMPQTMQQEWNVCMQKLISRKWFPNEQKIHIY